MEYQCREQPLSAAQKRRRKQIEETYGRHHLCRIVQCGGAADFITGYDNNIARLEAKMFDLRLFYIACVQGSPRLCKALQKIDADES